MPMPNFTPRIPPMIEEHNPLEPKGPTDAAIESAFLRGDLDTVADLVVLKTDFPAWVEQRAVPVEQEPLDTDEPSATDGG